MLQAEADEKLGVLCQLSEKKKKNPSLVQNSRNCAVPSLLSGLGELLTRTSACN